MAAIRRLGRLGLVIGVVVIVAIGGGGYALLHKADAAVQYRTGTVTLGTIQQTLSITGNLSPVGDASVNFAVAGTVNGVDVSEGQTVVAGQVLATLSASTLNNTLTQAEDSLAAARAKVTSDEDSTAATAAQLEQAVSQDETSLAADRTSYNDTVAVNNESLAQDQSQYNQAAAQVAADNHQYDVTDQCESASPPSPSNCSQDEQTLTKDKQTEAQDAAQIPAQKVKNKQSDDQAESQVTNAEQQLATAEQSEASGGSNGGSAASSAAQLAQDQLAVSEDEQTVTTDRQDANEATLTSPIAGQVATINTAVGDSVAGTSSSASSGSGGSGSGSDASTSSSSSSSTPAFLILSPGLFAVTGTVSDSEIDELTTGLAAEITPAGSTEAVTGKVTSVGIVGSVTSGVATFPVTVTLSTPDPALRDGMSASVSVIISQEVGVLTVPTSAVHTTASGSTVQVLKNGSPQSVTVTIGAADATETEIVSGLTQGQVIVIATITATLPTTTTGTGTGATGTGGRGGFTGGGGFGGAGLGA